MKYIKSKELFENGNFYGDLINLIRTGDDSGVRTVIEKDSASGRLNKEDFYGDTALSVAIYVDKLSYVKQLVDGGANVNHVNKRGEITFHEVENITILEYLYKNTEDMKINHQNKDGINTLMNSIFNNKEDIYKYLIEKGADLNLKDNKDRIFLDFFDNDDDLNDLIEYIEELGNINFDIEKYKMNINLKNFNI